LDPGTVTQLLSTWKAHDRVTEAELMRRVYPTIHRIASKQLAQSSQRTLRATELANDVLMEMRDSSSLQFSNSHDFYGMAARIARFYVVDYARKRGAQRRGGDIEFAPLDDAQSLATGADPFQVDALMLDQALTNLEADDQRSAQLVELRYYIGMNIEEAAKTMQISMATANRLWRYAKAFLSAHIQQNPMPTADNAPL
jgi:RNA polymerase sigma factor (TIGR02999 family)